MLLYVLLISHTEDTPSDSVDADDTMLDYYSVVDEALVVGTTYYKIKKTVLLLSICLKWIISKETTQCTIDNAT